VQRADPCDAACVAGGNPDCTCAFQTQGFPKDEVIIPKHSSERLRRRCEGRWGGSSRLEQLKNSGSLRPRPR
jgi:hypothetical protein